MQVLGMCPTLAVTVSAINGILSSALDALGMRTGFLISLSLLGGIREILGSRTLLGYQIMPNIFKP